MSLLLCMCVCVCVCVCVYVYMYVCVCKATSVAYLYFIKRKEVNQSEKKIYRVHFLFPIHLALGSFYIPLLLLLLFSAYSRWIRLLGRYFQAVWSRIITSTESSTAPRVLITHSGCRGEGGDGVVCSATWVVVDRG